MSLEAISRAAESAVSATAALRSAASDAHSAGEAVSDIAKAAGVTRQTIYRWISESATINQSDRNPS